LLIQLRDRGALGLLVNCFKNEDARTGNDYCKGNEDHFAIGVQGETVSGCSMALVSAMLGAGTSAFLVLP
jgi:hypothetical protein